MKAYTNLEQSKKLAEILPIESADMNYWCGTQIRIGGYKTMDKDLDIPCWRLAALLDVIKPINENTYTIRGTLDGGAIISFDDITNVMFQEEETIDAVFEMVVWLKENGKI